MPDTATNALRLEAVGHRFADSFQMNDLDLTVDPGELVCVLGPSGCGKSTLLRLIAGLEILQHGAIWVSGAQVAGDRINLPPEARNIGLMFQDYALFPHMTVLENICFGLARGDEDGQRRVRAGLEDMGLARLAGRYPHTLSGGQQQRIALLRALAPRPRVMLLDEPFSGLDEHLRQQVREETRNILQRAGAASLIVTHDPQEAMYLADRLVVLDDGRIVQVDTPVDVFHRPANPFIARLFGPVNEWQARVEGGGGLDTPGPIPTPDLGNGETARIMVRAAGIRVHPVDQQSLLADGTTLAEVIAARPLGQTTQLLVRPVSGATSSDKAVEIRLPGLELFDTGSQLALEVDPASAFVFAA